MALSLIQSCLLSQFFLEPKLLFIDEAKQTGADFSLPYKFQLNDMDSWDSDWDSCGLSVKISVN
jgi:hypothetical protein